MSRPAREFELADALMHARAVREQAETALVEARARLRQARQRRQTLTQELAGIDRRRQTCGKIDAQALVALAACREHLKQNLTRATQAVALAEHEMRQRVQALDQARQRVEALETLETRQRQARARWKIRREQDKADELAATRGAAKRRTRAD